MVLLMEKNIYNSYTTLSEIQGSQSGHVILAVDLTTSPEDVATSSSGTSQVFASICVIGVYSSED